MRRNAIIGRNLYFNVRELKSESCNAECASFEVRCFVTLFYKHILKCAFEEISSEFNYMRRKMTLTLDAEVRY